VLALPHKSSIQNWNGNVNAEPGFQRQVLNALKKFPEEDKDCALLLDSMAIRQQILWDEKNNKFVGYSDYGNDINLERNETLAKEALVFMLVSYNGKWKWPIAYFFKNSISSKILAELINTALILTAEVGIRVRSLTCDGENTNCAALKELGCTIFVHKFENLKNEFPHPTLQYNVRVLLDPCHMLKLARNALAEYGRFYDANSCIYWDHIVTLYKIQRQLTFKLKNKLSA